MVDRVLDNLLYYISWLYCFLIHRWWHWRSLYGNHDKRCSRCGRYWLGQNTRRT